MREYLILLLAGIVEIFHRYIISEYCSEDFSDGV